MAKYPESSSFSTEQLLALTLKENPQNPILNQLTAEFPSLKELATVTLPELTKIKGIGPRKAVALLASVELAKRLNMPAVGNPTVIRGPQDVSDLVMWEMRHLDREHFRILLLNTKNHVIKMDTVSVGTLSSTAIHPRELYKPAIKYSAAAVILVHNHPSGDCTPSREDIDVTRRLVEAGELLGISVLDHVAGFLVVNYHLPRRGLKKNIF